MPLHIPFSSIETQRHKLTHPLHKYIRCYECGCSSLKNQVYTHTNTIILLRGLDWAHETAWYWIKQSFHVKWALYWIKRLSSRTLALVQSQKTQLSLSISVTSLIEGKPADPATPCVCECVRVKGGVFVPSEQCGASFCTGRLTRWELAVH